ncbi:hypothetical protein M0802_011577 [Mischocyttarus mexicanus]|nr:hypothetical protein M0802_011577 [Mischocyttarus mexicanus]
MGSSRQQDRSLNAGISIPRWIRGKVINSRFDFDESTFSPPSHDEGFFHIQYPKSQISNSTTYNESTITASANPIVPTKQQTHSQFKEVKNIDFSQHPLPCQPFIPNAVNKTSTKLTGNIKPAKSQGTDDGFHGEPALCGKSIVHVVNKMMSNKFNKPPNSSVTPVEQEINLNKGSKSLPATPLASPITTPDSSPKSRRKAHANRYFTGSFIPDRDKYQGSWLLASLLGQSREILTSRIEEEEDSGIDLAPPNTLSRKKSISSQNLTYIGKDEKTQEKSSSQTNVFQARPSELREMNFWSPTSM